MLSIYIEQCNGQVSLYERATELHQHATPTHHNRYQADDNRLTASDLHKSWKIISATCFQHLYFSKKHISLIWIYLSYPTTELFQHQPHKMVKHTQKLCWLFSTKSLSVFKHFVELVLKGLIWKMLPEEYFQFEPRIFLRSQYFTHNILNQC